MVYHNACVILLNQFLSPFAFLILNTSDYHSEIRISMDIPTDVDTIAASPGQKSWSFSMIRALVTIT
jgi:hypothetical protein